MPDKAVLVVNAGSSSVKFALYEARPDGELARLWRGQIEGVHAEPRLTVRDEASRLVADERPALDRRDPHAGAIAALIGWVTAKVGEGGLVAVGHRVVHGGADFSEPVLVDADVIDALEGLIRLAPLHQPHNIAGLRAIAKSLPQLPQVACFDTAFHRTIPEIASAYALPRELREEGVRRYGFHGLSYAYVAGVLAETLPPERRRRAVVAHLGAGCSLCALRDGVSVDTTMGLTALDGLVMATRCGSIDPGVLLYLMREKGFGLEALEDLLYRNSGLLGASGLSADMRVLLDSEAPDARLAVDLFVHRLAREIAAMAASLGGMDALVFTAGIGERSAPIRARVCERLGWLGVRLDAAANGASLQVVSAPDSEVTTLAIPTDEELVIARHTAALLDR